MTADAGAVLVPIGILATLVGLAAVAAAILRSNYLKTSVELLRDNNADLTSRVALLEAEDARKTTQISGLEAENRALRDVVTGRDLLEALAAQSVATHAATLARLADMENGIVDRLEDIKNLCGVRRHGERQSGEGRT